jgi:hypothetical protein
MKKMLLGSIPHPSWDHVKEKLHPVNSVLDIGPGIRPQSLIKAKFNYCIEPHPEYAEQLRNSGNYFVISSPALDCLSAFEGVDSAVMLDCIEHMTRENGEAVIKLLKQIVSDQIVIYTPNGFMEQTTGEFDKWGYPGTHWQDHMSGWSPSDFEGWEIVPDGSAFFAIYTKPNVGGSK